MKSKALYETEKQATREGPNFNFSDYRRKKINLKFRWKLNLRLLRGGGGGLDYIGKVPFSA